MRIKHTVVRTDAMVGTQEGSYLESVIFNSTGKKGGVVSDVDNGIVVDLGDLVENERDVYYAKAATTEGAIGKVLAIEKAGSLKYYVIKFNANVPQAVIASPEVMAEENLDGLSDFFNGAGEKARVYRIHEHDQFSVSSEGIDGELAVGDEVKAENGKFKKHEAA